LASYIGVYGNNGVGKRLRGALRRGLEGLPGIQSNSVLTDRRWVSAICNEIRVPPYSFE
jgi:hypothetical protein